MSNHERIAQVANFLAKKRAIRSENWWANSQPRKNVPKDVSEVRFTSQVYYTPLQKTNMQETEINNTIPLVLLFMDN